MKLHFTGIGGIGMSALAQWCVAEGHDVAGSDLSETEIWPVLEKLPIQLFLDQKAENVHSDTDVLVYSEAVPETNPERQKAVELGIPQQSYFSFLGSFSKEKRTIAVTGTHGKTTTTALVAAGMIGANADPTVVVGSTLPLLGGSNFHAGQSEWLVVEACEYRENFKFLSPEIVLLTNVEWDHPDAFPTEDDYFAAFERFVSEANVVIYHAGDPGAERVLKNFTGTTIAVEPHDGAIDLQLVGDFNQKNAALTIALANYLDLDIPTFETGLRSCTTIGRRQEYIGEKNGVHIYDDYGHHPTEIRATVQAFRSKFPEAHIGLIFEPHQFSRTRALLPEFIEVLKDIEVLGLHPIYEARDSQEDKDAQPLEKMLDQLPHAQKVEDIETAETLLAQLKTGDILLCMGAGNMGTFVRTLQA